MPKIICGWCGSEYFAHNENRNHCRRSSCRNKEIESQLKDLSELFSLILRHGIRALVEIRLPGNDTIGRQAKIVSSGTINRKIFPEPESPEDFEKQVYDATDYFRSLLWKNIKGNFKVKTRKGGVIQTDITHEMFTEIKNPVILSDNKIILLQDLSKNLQRKGD